MVLGWNFVTSRIGSEIEWPVVNCILNVIKLLLLISTWLEMELNRKVNKEFEFKLNRNKRSDFLDFKFINDTFQFRATTTQQTF